MKKKISLFVAVIIALLFGLAVFMATFSLMTFKNVSDALNNAEIPDTSATDATEDSADKRTDNEFINRLAERIAEVDEIYRSIYIGELDDEFLIDCAIDGYVAGTEDKYGRYYNAEDFKEWTSDIEGEFAGIGVNVIFNADYQVIEVINVFPDSPADRAGVLPGDLVIYAGEEHESVIDLGYYGAIDKIRGEIGTKAYFTVARGENYEKEIDFEVEREQVTAVSVTYHKYALDEEVGVIKITEFDVPTSEQFIEAVNALVNDGCKKLVVDLRYNPGGELNSIVQTLDFIVPAGPIVHIMDADGKEVRAMYSDPRELDIPMAVLVNGSTASAAELFTSTVRDYDKAVIVGTTTYGKGCMQTTVPLSTGGAVTVTYRMYNPPFSENYHDVGIVPDIEVELDEALAEKNVFKITDEEDNQLRAAVEALAD